MVDSDFRHWLAGFIDGEGCFYITGAGKSRPGVWRPRFSLTLRCDDRPTIEAAQVAVGGLGTIHEYEPTGPGRRVVRWMFQSQSDCEALCAILDIHPLRSKKANDYRIWRGAVADAADLRRGKKDGTSAANAEIYARIKLCKDEITEVRAYE
jgi:hypothetical protein